MHLKPLRTDLPPLKRHICGEVPHYEHSECDRRGWIDGEIRIMCCCGEMIRKVEHYKIGCEQFEYTHYQELADRWNYNYRGVVEQPELLNCPCCGGNAKFQAECDCDAYQNWLAIRCGNCGLGIEGYHSGLEDELEYYPQWEYDDIAAKWNRRWPHRAAED